MRAALELDGPAAGTRLADQLRLAWVAAGRPSMSTLGDHVGYSKATISKVLSGKMAPAWRLVVKLGRELGVSTATVQQEWHPLWIAADSHRWRVPSSSRPAYGAGESCQTCGCWVTDIDRHRAWHEDLNERTARAAESLRWATLRDALPRRDRP
ncbi:hypothetical protein GCM10012284_34400 [Mangrovihabitans endophyticus]|uniref:HTH cro/C1-type domain-containing protein n=2 Tax=Mangrovihabitans endophyticus TaxID=1751298 RepID=A0A8J3FPP8_9ACTN|nr:hypothetical protein GCM10012284_34400 [Mangrovihabitans endophyticus]